MKEFEISTSLEIADGYPRVLASYPTDENTRPYLAIWSRGRPGGVAAAEAR
jgi:hypothetical protein